MPHRICHGLRFFGGCLYYLRSLVRCIHDPVDTFDAAVRRRPLALTAGGDDENIRSAVAL